MGQLGLPLRAPLVTADHGVGLPPAALAYLDFVTGRAVSTAPDAVRRAAIVEHAASYLRGSRHRAVLELADGGRVLDVGCELGIIAKALSPRASTIVAIDMRPEAIAIARAFFAAPNIEYRAVDVSSVDLDEHTFDSILFLETIEHVESPVGTLTRLRRLLKPRGTLLISTPNALSYHEVLRQLARLWPGFRADRGLRKVFDQVEGEIPGSGTQSDHLYSWTWETLYRLAYRTGFRYRDHRRVSFWPPSLPMPSGRARPFGRRELMFLRPVAGAFCQTLLLKLEAAD